jgi:hypothetical protein
MIIAKCFLKSESSLQMSKNYEHIMPKNEKENHKDYENRTWQERLHYTKKGYIFIPGIMFKNCIAAAAKYLSIQIPGKGKSTYTKNFEAGVQVIQDIILPVKKEDASPNWQYVPSDGMRGGTKRVWKCFPYVEEWEGEIEFRILDETITQDVFEYHLNQAGAFIGIGFWRPRQNGMSGRFKLISCEWIEV